MRSTTADVAVEEAFDLGEGPIWQAPDRLTWVDVLEGRFIVASVTGGNVTVEQRHQTDDLHVAAALPLPDPDAGWLLAAGSGFAHMAADGTVRILAEPEAERRGVVR